MLGDRWNWMRDPARGCRDLPTNMFFPPGATEDDEAPYPPPDVMAICEHCPVRAACLDWALKTGQRFGVWGGLSGYQRSLINQTKTRKTCPGCGSEEIVVENRHEICMSCTVSWPII